MKKISFKLNYLITIIKIILKSIFFKNKAYIFCTPIHGNIGDQAIIIAEREFLKDKFPKFKIIEIESNLIIKFKKILPKLVNNSPIFIHGGGFLGTLWLEEEKIFRNILKEYSKNFIIVFPQTVYFSNDEFGNKILEESKKIYSSHSKLFICCRETYSYDFMKKNIPECKTLLIPDMVLYLNKIKTKTISKDILFCIRSDKEKVNYNLENIENKLKKEYKLDYTDTVIPKIVFPNSRNKIFNNKIKQFSEYKLIITDRLHGMVFALLSKTPCLVLENKSYKIRGVYDWIKEINYIKLTNEKNIEKDLNEMLNKNINHFDNKDLKNKYDDLEKLIKDNME